MTRNLVSILLLLMACSHWSCIKSGSPSNEAKAYFIKAKFNNVPWEIRKNGQASFQADLDTYRNRWILRILSDNGEANTTCRGIWFTFDYMPTVGKHYFNNDPLSYLPDSGLIANYSYYNTIANVWLSRYSMNGYIDIKEINREEMKADFVFDATSDSSSDSAIIKVTEGSFYLQNPGSLWP